MYQHQRFESYLAPPTEKGCRIWRGIVKAGRGMFLLSTRPHKWISAAKWAYQFYEGPVPLGYVVKARCGEPLCMEHLKLVKANILVIQAIKSGRLDPYSHLKGHVPWYKGLQNPKGRYPDSLVQAIRQDYQNGLKIQVISMRRKMATSTVWWLVTKRAVTNL